MNYDFRFAEPGDAAQVTEMIVQAGDGLFESLLDGIVPGVGARQFIRMAVAAEDSPLHFGNAILAEQDGRLCGMALCYSAAAYGLHPVLKNVVPKSRLEPLMPLFASKVPDSWYLNSLTVAEHARGHGLGKLLVQFCGELAVEEGLPTMSLHAWADNDAALRMYRDLGFTEVATVPVRLRTESRHEGGMLLLKAALPLRG